jgi:uncharacterized protein with GYD domain
MCPHDGRSREPLATLRIRDFALAGTHEVRTRDAETTEEGTMPLYVMLTRLTDQGAKTVKEDPARIKVVDGQLGEMGLKVLHQYAVLGRYDFVNIVEAPDQETVVRASVELGARGSIRVETLAAMDVDEFIAAQQR